LQDENASVHLALIYLCVLCERLGCGVDKDLRIQLLYFCNVLNEKLMSATSSGLNWIGKKKKKHSNETSLTSSRAPLIRWPYTHLKFECTFFFAALECNFLF